MKNGIETGEYVRTEEGYIGKFIGYVPYTFNYIKMDVGRGIINYIYTRDGFQLKHSPNLIDIIEDEDFCKIEFYSPRYEERVIRIFEVSKIDEYIIFENFHCDLFMANGEWSCHDKRLNPIIKSIVTKEQFESVSYRVREQ